MTAVGEFSPFHVMTYLPDGSQSSESQEDVASIALQVLKASCTALF